MQPYQANFIHVVEESKLEILDRSESEKFGR